MEFIECEVKFVLYCFSSSVISISLMNDMRCCRRGQAC
jgi:hypothetical protein